jgi:hypothetical protein
MSIVRFFRVFVRFRLALLVDLLVDLDARARQIHVRGLVRFELARSALRVVGHRVALPPVEGDRLAPGVDRYAPQEC